MILNLEAGRNQLSKYETPEQKEEKYFTKPWTKKAQTEVAVLTPNMQAEHSVKEFCICANSTAIWVNSLVGKKQRETWLSSDTGGRIELA